MVKMDKEELIEKLKNSGFLKSENLVEAFGKIAREKFVRKENQKQAYDDAPLSIGSGQTISAPHMVAVMTEALEVEDKQKILEIGTGSGYQAAILSVLNPNGIIYTIESVKDLYNFSRENLKDYKNVKVVLGDGSLGYEKEKPYDRIIATCGCPEIPEAWIEQLNQNGKLLAPVGSMYIQSLTIVEKNRGKTIKEDLSFPCAFVPLRGKYGWQ